MRRRHPNPRLAKSLLTYSVAEIAVLYGCHRNTVRNWIQLGLNPIDDRRPALVRGDVLNAFHAARRNAGKQPCGPGEIYCPPCHKRQRPSGDLVEWVPINGKVWKVSAVCPGCDRVMTQRVGIDRLSHFLALNDPSGAKPQARITDALPSSVNCDFTEKDPHG
jgi:hypothetical protein